METSAETCSYFIRSKSRSCKFPRCGDSEFCALHKGVHREASLGDADGDSGRQIVPCSIDGRHFVSREKLRSHIRKCSRVRDVAYELSQPFCMHACGPPRQLWGLRERLQTTETYSGECPARRESLSEKKPVVSEERLEFVERLHDICVREFGSNPHLGPDKTGIDCPGLNRHELQAVSISKELTSRMLAGERALRLAHLGPEKSLAVVGEDSLVVEFGAGNAVLSHWFIKECGRRPETGESSAVRCVIIDRESRRKQMEKLGRSICPIRLRLDIEQFDIKALISACNARNTNVSRESIEEQMYSGLGDGDVPWIINVLLEQGIWVCGPSGEKIRTTEGARRLGREELRQILAGLSRGGGPDIASVEERFMESFAGRPVEKMFVISKHLCGNGFDLGLRSSRSAITKMKSGSVLVVVMSPCCHHRCSFSQHLGVEMLEEHASGETPFERPEDCFRFLASVSSWSTGADGRRSELGYKAKYILDSCRLFWLRKEGFTNVVYSTFTSKAVSPENILVTGVYVKK